MSAAKDPREVVWAVHDGIKHAGQMMRSHIAMSDGWTEVDVDHRKVKAALAGDSTLTPELPTPTPDVGIPKEN